MYSSILTEMSKEVNRELEHSIHADILNCIERLKISIERYSETFNRPTDPIIEYVNDQLKGIDSWIAY